MPACSPFTLIFASFLSSAFCATARVALKDVPSLAPDKDATSYTLPKYIADHLREKLADSSSQPLRISEEPWGSKRPRCFCKQLAVWGTDGKHKKVIVVEPNLGTEDLSSKDAWSLAWVALEMSAGQASGNAAAEAVPFKDIPVLVPDASVAKLKLPTSIAADLVDAVHGQPVRVSEEPWGAERPRCLCRNLGIWDSSGLHKQILMVEPEIGSNKLIGKDVKAFQDAVVKIAAHSSSEKNVENAKSDSASKWV